MVYIHDGKRDSLSCLKLKLVFTTAGSQVEFEMVNGEILIENGEPVIMEEENALKKIRKVREPIGGAKP